MAAEQANEKEYGLELHDLYLETTAGDGKAKYPVLSATVNLAIGQMPVVTVVLSGGAHLVNTTDSLGSEANNINDIELGAIADLVLSLGRAGSDKKQKVVLFSGYVMVSTPSIQTNYISIQSEMTIQLTCGLGALSGIPMGSLMYFGLGASQQNNIQGVSYSALLGQRAREIHKDGDIEATNKFCANPAQFMADMLDAIRNMLRSPGSDAKLVKDAVISCTGPLKVKLQSGLPSIEFRRQAVSAMQSAPVLTVLNQLLKQIFVSMVPQPVCDAGVPCRILMRPVSAWDVSQTYPEITPKDILSVQETSTEYFDNWIDYWIVSFPSNISTIYGKLAMYGPGSEGNHGNAQVLKPEEFREAVKKRTAGTGSPSYVGARVIPIPGWLYRMQIHKEVVAAPETTSAGDKVTTSDTEQTATSVEDVARRVAVVSYLINGRSVCSVGLAVPLEVYLRALKDFSSVWKLQVPISGKIDAQDLDTKVYYGLLSNMSMRIAVADKALRATCVMYFNQVHDEEMHETYAADNPIHTIDTKTLEKGLAPATKLYEGLNESK